MKPSCLLLAGGVLAVALTPGVLAGAVVLYDNTASTSIGGFWPEIYEAGNQVMLAGGAAADITQFQFQYYNNDPGGTEMLEFRIYANDGAEYLPGDPTSKEPGTLLFDSHTFPAPTAPMSAVTFNTSDFGPGGLAVPNSFTWTIQFSNLGLGGHAGVGLFTGHTVGQAYEDIWVNNTGGWVLSASYPPHSSFAAQITGIAVPEPAQYGLVFGAIALLPLVWNRLGGKVKQARSPS
jgi:hypothetical protein